MLRKAFATSEAANGDELVEGGVLALVSEQQEDDRFNQIQLAAAFSTPCMGVGFVHSQIEEPQVQILRQPKPNVHADKTAISLHVSFLNIC